MSEPIEGLEAPASILRRIQGLIAKAEGTTNEHEREAFFKKADEIAAKYALDLAKLDATRSQNEREKPTTVNIDFPYSGFDSYLSRMLKAMCNLAGVRIRRKGHYNNFVLVGFQSDVDYVQMLWMSAHLTFMSKIRPRWDDAKSADENIKVMKEAGISWPVIADHANAHGFECKANDGKLKAAYRRQCKKEGVEPTPHTQRNRAYRESYAIYFTDKIENRLFSMGLKRDEMKSGSGMELVLFDRTKLVNEMFWDLFPEMHPDAVKARRAAELQRMADADREEEERRAKLTPKQREAEDRKREREEERYGKRERLYRRRMWDENGARAGERAGASVDLSAGRNGVQQNSAKQIG